MFCFVSLFVGVVGDFGLFTGAFGCLFQRNSISLLTPLKINMEPQNDGLEDDFPLQRAVRFFRFHLKFLGNTLGKNFPSLVEGTHIGLREILSQNDVCTL